MMTILRNLYFLARAVIFDGRWPVGHISERTNIGYLRFWLSLANMSSCVQRKCEKKIDTSIFNYDDHI